MLDESNKSAALVDNNRVVMHSIIAGSIAGMASCTIFHPFDVVRTKMQTAPTSSSRGPIATMRHVFQFGGIRSLYTGYSLPLAAQAAYKSTVYTTNRLVKELLLTQHSEDNKELTYSEYFVSGAASGFVNALIFVSPVEYVRAQLIEQHTRLAKVASTAGNTPPLVPPITSSSTTTSGPIHVIRTTLHQNGIVGLWRGTGVTVIRDSIGCGAFFVVYEFGQKFLPILTGLSNYDDNTNHNTNPLMIHTAGSAMMGGFGYWAISMPLDSLKTLVQTGNAKSAMGAVKVLVETDGWYHGIRSLYRGWQVAFGRGSPSAAVSLLTYTTIFRYISNDEND